VLLRRVQRKNGNSRGEEITVIKTGGYCIPQESEETQGRQAKHGRLRPETSLTPRKKQEREGKSSSDCQGSEGGLGNRRMKTQEEGGNKS